MIATLIGVVTGVAGTLLLLRRWQRPEAEPSETPQDGPRPEPPADPRARVYQIVHALAETYRSCGRPDDLLDHPGVQEAVELLASDAFEDGERLDWFGGTNSFLQTLSAIALARGEPRGSEFRDRLLANTEVANVFAKHFALRALESRVDAPLFARVLATLDDYWSRPIPRGELRAFFERRVAAGDQELDDREASRVDSDELDWIVPLLREAGAAAAADKLSGRAAERADDDLLSEVGRTWPTVDTSRIVTTDLFARRVEELEKHVLAPRPRGVVLVGERGVGKSTLVRLLAAKLVADGWTVFEAGAVEIIAGQSFIGELEERMRELLSTLADRPKLLWIVPDLAELGTAGRHRYSTVSVLNMIWPMLEAGRLRIVGELTRDGLERLLRDEPRVRTAFEVVHVSPTRDAECLEIGRRWARQVAGPDGEPVCSDHVVREAQQLAQQFLGRSAQPGGLMELLDRTLETRRAMDVHGPFGTDDVLISLARMSGLPRTVIDERESLDLAALEALFAERVVGQPEAIACLVDRVAMIKAGLTDPDRPLGVFLFTGPTGTGKTEIAKTLATFLFGSSERMLRLDMSEFQTFDSLARLLGERDEAPGATALVHDIRNQPFAVVLLDEVEKAHPAVWDLFLQVFDDGRLTDRRGRTADFRHAIIVMTSNVGAAAATGAAMTFGAARSVTGLDPAVEKQILAQFRPEFVNRLDRIVVFRSLDRGDMRRVLHKELRLVLERRGLRNRQWAVEWDDSAIEFLLERGFSPELGARPLRRTIERYLLAPLAKTIAQQRAPTGDQFLFVRSDGQRLSVQFVDPDAPDEPRAQPVSGTQGASLGQIAFEPRGVASEVDVLAASYASLRELVESNGWRRRKEAALEATAEPDFWTSSRRWSVLADAEYVDRIGVGLETAGRLLSRLRGPDGTPRRNAPRDLVARLAERLHLLSRAVDAFERDRPADAFVRIEAVGDGATTDADALSAARCIDAMYRVWAEKRRMSLEALDDSNAGERGQWRRDYGVVGFGAFPILENESGLHVFESLRDGTDTVDRHRVRVTVVPQPDDAAPRDRAGRARLAADLLDRADEHRTRIVRRYRREPSPLVRDAIHGWRTGRIDRVLDGDFDLL